MADDKRADQNSADENKTEIIETAIDLTGGNDAAESADVPEDDATADVKGDDSGAKTKVVETPLDLDGAGKTEVIEKPAAGAVDTAVAEKVDLKKVGDEKAGSKEGDSDDSEATEEVDYSLPAPKRSKSSSITSSDEDTRTIRTGIKLLLIAVILAAIATLLAFHPGATTSENKAFVNKDATSELLSQATERVCAPFAYKHEQVEEYLNKARSNMVDKARENFDKYAETQRKIIVQAKADAECHVDQIGVADQTKDRAVVIAAMVISTTANGTPTDSGTPRAQYVFVKRDGQWLISDVGDV